jgi:hypothetical protein
MHQSDNTKSKNQRQNRRRDTLLKKAHQYCVMKNGKTFIFNSNPSEQWPPSREQLVCFIEIDLGTRLTDINRRRGILCQSRRLRGI